MSKSKSSRLSKILDETKPLEINICKSKNAASVRLGGLVVSALDFQAGYRGFESRSGRDNFQTIITPSSYSTCPGLSLKWTGRRLVIDSGTKCAWVIHESKAVQIHLHHSNRRCLYVPRVLGSVKNPHNNNNNRSSKYRELKSFNNISLCITRNNHHENMPI